MLGLVLTLAVATAPIPSAAGMPTAAPDSVASVDGAAACEVVPAPFEELPPAEVTFATPAVIDCRNEVLPLVLSTLVGECDGTPHDTSYRISRTADGEEIPQTVAPAARDKRAGVATCDRLPPRVPRLQLLDGQALALAATPVLSIPETEVRYPRDSLSLPTRFADPPDRPPRI